MIPFLIATMFLSLHSEAQCLIVGHVETSFSGDTTLVWVEGGATNNCFPKPDSASLEWRFMCKGGDVTKVLSGTDDTVKMLLGQEVTVMCRVVWHRPNYDTYTPIRTICIDGPWDGCVEEPSQAQPPQPIVQEVTYLNGCVEVEDSPGTGYTIIFLDLNWAPVMFSENSSVCDPPGVMYYVLWYAPNYKVSPVYGI